MPAPENRSTQAPQKRRPMRHAGCAALLAFGISVVGLCACLVPVLVRHYWVLPEIQGLSPDIQARLPQIMGEPLRLPAEWQHPRPVPPEVIECFKKMNEAFSRLPLKVSQTLDQVDKAIGSRSWRALKADEWSSCAIVLLESQPLIQEIVRLTNCPGYDAEFFANPPGMGHRTYCSLYDSSTLLRLQVYQAARTGDWDSVLSYSLTCYRLGHCHLASPLYIHRIGDWAYGAGHRGMQALAAECVSTPVLTRALDELNRLKPVRHPEVASRPEVFMVLGGLRALIREGYPVDLSLAKSLVYYRTQLERAEEDFPQWKLRQLATNDPDYQPLREYIAEHNRDKSMDWRLEAALVIAPEELLIHDMRYMDSWEVAGRLSKVQYDLLRLQLAGRLLQAEGQSSATLAHCLKRYLPNEPQDPFSGKPYSWDASHGRFYSIGPDGIDDHAKYVYDPANYWSHRSNRGDLVLEP